MKKSVLLVGEPMGLFIANETGRLEDVDEFTLTTCGAEFNVAVGLKRLDHDVTYMTRLGEDPFGKKIINMMRKTGISTEEIILSRTNPTGFMFKEKAEAGADPGIFYFRKGSAASTLSAADVEKLDFTKFDIVHLTGITPALTQSCREASEAINRRAREAGCLFSFDPNLRPQLWPSKEIMSDYMNRMAAKSDLFLPGINEVKTILGESDPETAAGRYLSMGTGTVVLKLGAKGAYYAQRGGTSGYVDSFPVKKIVDTVGAGDGFAAGVLSGLREGLSLEEAVRRGCAVGAVQVMSKGDNDGLPYRDELDAFMAGREKWRRQHA